eukprot:SM000177S03173  [mRNA]  locus=s177:33663:35081:+ [translate_table: standard]
MSIETGPYFFQLGIDSPPPHLFPAPDFCPLVRSFSIGAIAELSQRLTPSPPACGSSRSYIIEGNVCYLTLCDRSYPKKLAYQYLEELQREFEKVNGDQIDTVARPYAFIKFDTFIQKTRKLYLDTRTQRNLSKLNDDLIEVQQIMTRNIQEVLGVGERLDQASQMSSKLSSEARLYASKAKDLSRQAFIKKWAPVVVVALVVLLVIFVRTKFYGN